MSNTVGLVLLHGAGLGSWIWDDLKPYLQCPALAVGYPGRNGSPSGVDSTLRLDDYCSHIQERILKWRTGRVVMAAHSIGGVLALKLADQLDNRVVGFAGISATIPRNGGSFVSTLPVFKRMIMNILLRTAGTKPPESAIIHSLCNDLREEQVEKVVNQFVPESRHLFLDKCLAPVPGIESIYIRTTKDQEYTESYQDQMIENLDPGQIISLNSGHLPMMRHPVELADVLNQFVSKCETAAPKGSVDPPRV